MGLRYEAWSLPWGTGTFKRKIAKLPVPVGAGSGSRQFLSVQEEGTISLNPDQFDRVGEIIGDAVGSLVRVYDGTDLIHEWTAERNSRATDDDNRNMDISGPGIKAALDKAFVHPFDYPANPTENPDHVWAGRDALSDGGMEKGKTDPEIYEIDLDGANGGDFTLTVGGATTDPIPWNASAGTVENELEALNGTPPVVEVQVTERSDGFQIEFVDPIILDTNMTWTPSLTGGGGNEELTVKQEGADDIPANWTTSQYADRFADPALHGTYSSDGFRLTEAPDPVRSGNHSLRINGKSQFAGGQQIVEVEPGQRYQAQAHVWSSDTTEKFRLVIRDRHENLIAWVNFNNTTGSQWEALDIDFVSALPDGTPVDTIIFRVAQTVDHNPIPYYVDDCSLKFGAPEANPGEIINALFDDAVVDHAADPRGIVLDWIDYSAISTVNDSSAVPWTASHSFEARFGETYGQVMDKLVDLGYEWDLVPKATPSGGKTHDLVVYNEGNLDNAPSTAINVRQGVIGGNVVKRIPSYTVVLVEGADGLYVRVAADTATTDAFGFIEKYFQASHLLDPTSLTQHANQLLTAEAANRTAVRFEIVETGRHPKPFISYGLGDTIPMQMPPLLPKESRRVQRIDYTNTFPASYVVTGSKVLPGTAGAFDLLYRLWRRFDKPRIARRSGVATVQEAAELTGAHIHLERIATQSIPDATETAIVWDHISAVLPAYEFDEPAIPTSSLIVKEPGYYDFGLDLQMASAVASPSIRIGRTRSGAETTVWPLDSDPGIWAVTYDADTFSNVAKGIPCELDDVIQVYLQHSQGAAVDLSNAVLSAELVDRNQEISREALFVHTEVPQRSVAFAGEVLFDKTFSYPYDGTSTLWLAGGANGTDTWWVDNEIDIYVDHEDTSQGSPYPKTISGGGSPGPGSPLSPNDITNLFEAGTNTLRIVVRDTSGFLIGCSDLWIVPL